nr:hypothetical protein [Pseudomonas yangonensis]
MTVEETLLNRYGGSPLLSLEQLAEVLHRSKNGLRISLSSDNELSAKLRSCKVKIGRRIYFTLASSKKPDRYEHQSHELGMGAAAPARAEASSHGAR